MSRLKRSRALRRNLRKQARKGTLSAREQKTLLSQEKKFRKARRPLMRGLGFGAGLGAGAAALLGAGGIAKALAQGLITRRQAEDMMNEEEQDGGNVQGDGDGSLLGADGSNLNPNLDYGYDIPEEDMPDPVVGGPGAVEDVVVVGEEEGEEEEEATAAEERQATPEEQARAERSTQRAERAREAGVDAALEAGLGGAESPGGDLEEAERQAALVDTPHRNQWNYVSPVFREMYPGPERTATGGSRDEMTRRIGNMVGAKEALRPEEGIGLGGFTDYTGGFDFLPADDPMQSLAPLLPQQIDRGASEMGGTPKSQARSQVQQAANEASRLRMEDASARGQEYNKLLNQVLDNADLINKNPLLGDAGVQRALRGFGRTGGRRSSSFAEGGRIDKSNDLVARIKRKYGLR